MSLLCFSVFTSQICHGGGCSVPRLQRKKLRSEILPTGRQMILILGRPGPVPHGRTFNLQKYPPGGPGTNVQTYWTRCLRGPRQSAVCSNTWTASKPPVEPVLPSHLLGPWITSEISNIYLELWLQFQYKAIKLEQDGLQDSARLNHCDKKYEGGV